MDRYYDRVKTMPRAVGVDEVLMPGEPEARREAERLRNGIPITDNVISDLTFEGDRSDQFPSGSTTAA